MDFAWKFQASHSEISKKNYEFMTILGVFYDNLGHFWPKFYDILGLLHEN